MCRRDSWEVQNSTQLLGHCLPGLLRFLVVAIFRTLSPEIISGFALAVFENSVVGPALFLWGGLWITWRRAIVAAAPSAAREGKRNGDHNRR